MKTERRRVQCGGGYAGGWAWVWMALILSGGATWGGEAAEAGGDDAWVSKAFEGEIRPLLAKYCFDCHSSAKAKGDLDLERFGTMAEVGREPRVWEGVLEQLSQGEMPPKDKVQPTPEESVRFKERIGGVLRAMALARAGDPGAVVLRRLSNAEYTYSLRDLTGVEELRPAEEFPVDGAAGEGFMNTGNALVMSPTLLTKYLEAARGVAALAVPLPSGFRFSASVSRRDWTEEVLGRIREFYRRYTDPRGGTQVHLQGLVWETNEGGRLPLARYVGAALSEREGLRRGTTTPGAVAAWHGLNAKYLGTLWAALEGREPSVVLDPIRRVWLGAKEGEAGRIVEAVGRWQEVLWKFGSVGHIGKVGGPKAWMEPVEPLVERQEMRLPIREGTGGGGEVVVRMSVGSAGDGGVGDVAVWERPRFVAAGRPDLPLRDLRRVSSELARIRDRVIASVPACLAAAAEIEARAEAGQPSRPEEVGDMARRHGVSEVILEAWLGYLGLDSGGPGRVEGHLTQALRDVGGFDFVRGWGRPETPSVVANRGDREVRIPGRLGARGVVVHPSPALRVGVAWQSPVTGVVRVEAGLTHAHPECGNGVTWVAEVRRGVTRHRLGSGVAQGGKRVGVGPLEGLRVRAGDVVAVLVGPRDGNHACDLTAVELEVTEGGEGGGGRVWNLAMDVAGNIEEANPHADRYGHAGVWHFFAEPDAARGDGGVVVPPGSMLARWQGSRVAEERTKLALELASLLAEEVEGGWGEADRRLREELRAWRGPLYRGLVKRLLVEGEGAGSLVGDGYGPDPAAFGSRGEGGEVHAESWVVRAPATMEFRVPLELVGGSELVSTGVLAGGAGGEGSVQFEVRVVGEAGGVLGVEEGRLVPGLPVVCGAAGGARSRYEAAFHAFRQVFPAALAYTKIVPVDEVVTLTLFHREDEPLRRLMLNGSEVEELDRMWEELHFVSQDALTLVDAYAQLMEYATQDADPKVFEPLRVPIQARAAAFRAELEAAEARQVEALLGFAGRAYRRPLEEGEKGELRALYGRLRGQELSHDEAFRMVLTRILVAPAFLYRVEKPGPGKEAKAVSDWELATRLSYFLWSSVPDAELREAAEAGRLREPGGIVVQARRMLGHGNVRRLATEFGCQWLHIHGFDGLDEKSERHFPSFGSLKGAMYEEAIRFFTGFFRDDGTVGGLIDGDHVEVNEALARHYGLGGVSGSEWRRLSGVRSQGRGGILGLAATLAKQSGASRTSPILRGNWVSEVLLGEKLPRPPKDVPRLPEDEAATEGRTVRELVERHSSDPRCAGCHQRIDPYGFALENYDAIGRWRERDLGDRPIATRTKTADGVEFEGLEGLSGYLLERRGETFRRQFCRKLLGYALGRAVEISDQPLIDSMLKRLREGEDRVGVLVEAIVTSRQFREIRGVEAGVEP